MYLLTLFNVRSHFTGGTMNNWDGNGENRRLLLALLLNNRIADDKSDKLIRFLSSFAK